MNVNTEKKKLLTKYQYKIEMHAHSRPASVCSEVSPKELVDIYKGLGFDAITLTNHFLHEMSKDEYIHRFLNDYEEARIRGEEVGLKVYLGAEIRFTENINDYLVYGVDRRLLEDIYERLPEGIKAFRENYRMPQSVLIQAHPFRNGIERVSPDLVDGIEVFNLHPNHNSKVGLAAAYAKENNFNIITAGTDYHHPNCGHDGLTALRCRSLPKDSFDLAKLLKSGDYLLEAGGNNIIIP